MPRPELGTKRTDPETGKRFYDLGKDPVVSPYTGTSYPLSFFQEPAHAPSRYAPAAEKPVHREDNQDDADDTRDADAETVSLSDIEEDEADDAKADAVDIDDDEEADKDEGDTFLALDEDEGDDDVNDYVGERDEEEG